MNDSQSSLKFKLAAIDLDGTLLGPDAILHPANLEAVARLQRAGVHIVLASGRHFQSMIPFAQKLSKIEWLVSSQGGDVSNASRTVVLASEFLSSAKVAEIVQAGKSLGFSPLAFGVNGVSSVSDWNADLEFYYQLDGFRPAYRLLDNLLPEKIFKIIWVGSPQKVAEHRERIPLSLSGLQIVQTDARFLEFMPAGTSKGAALDVLTQHLGMRPSEALAFGDGNNDVPMFEWAGFSVAMPHGWPAALKAASCVAPSGPPETALARGINFLFAKGLLQARADGKNSSSVSGHGHVLEQPFQAQA